MSQNETDWQSEADRLGVVVSQRGRRRWIVEAEINGRRRQIIASTPATALAMWKIALSTMAFQAAPAETSNGSSPRARRRR